MNIDRVSPYAAFPWSAWARRLVPVLVGVLAMVWSVVASADTPGTTLIVNPNTNLASTQSVQVSGTGFGPSGSGAVTQCVQIEVDGTEACSDSLATFTTTAQGAFGPVNVTVTKIFTVDGVPQNCPGLFGPCTLFAAMNGQPQDDHQTITFATGPTTSTTLPAINRKPADFDGDRDTDRSVYRNGAWFAEGQATAFLGNATDIPVPGDYNLDGRADKAVYRSGTWFTEGQANAFLGTATDIPVPGDYNGDGRTERAVYRPSVGGWYVEGQAPVFFGVSTDIPVPGDYDGNGTTDKAVYRPSVGGWYISGQATVFNGLSSDIPVPGDYDGNKTTDKAVFRPSVGGWYIAGQATVFSGLSGDIPVPGDYDGNGTWDKAVWRKGVGGWYTSGQTTVFLGLSTDIPLPLPQAIYRKFFTP